MAALTKVQHDLFPDESASADDNDFHGCPPRCAVWSRISDLTQLSYQESISSQPKVRLGLLLRSAPSCTTMDRLSADEAERQGSVAGGMQGSCVAKRRDAGPVSFSRWFGLGSWHPHSCAA